MANIPGQILGSFEDLGKQIGTEVAKAPTEIAGKALESLGASAKGPKGPAPAQVASEKSKEAPTPLDEFSQADAKTKQAIARRALEYLAAKKGEAPSVRERLEREEAEKRAKEEKEAKEKAPLPPLEMPKGKRRRGDLYGMSAKTSLEKKTQVRQD